MIQSLRWSDSMNQYVLELDREELKSSQGPLRGMGDLMYGYMIRRVSEQTGE